MGCCNTCGCNNGSCGCNYTVVLGDENPTAYNFQSVNLTGIGVLDGVSGLDVNFRGVSSANALLGVSLDNGNHTILLTVDIAAIKAAIPQATTTVAGIGETATDAEALAKASILTFLTPSNLAAMGSTSTFAGLVELATDAEAITGTSTTLALTPANLTAVNALQKTTVTFADAVTRAATIPAFEGQFGGQLDTDVPYYATTPLANGWRQMFLAGSSNDLTIGTGINLMTGATLTFTGDGTGSYNFSSNPVNFSLSTITFDSTCTVVFSACAIDFTGSTAATSGPATDAVMTVDGGGVLVTKDISDFLSADNTNTGWTNFTNSAVRKTGDCNTITLPQLAQVVDTLIRTLGTSLLTPVP